MVDVNPAASLTKGGAAAATWTALSQTLKKERGVYDNAERETFFFYGVSRTLFQFQLLSLNFYEIVSFYDVLEVFV